jgi:hypothetical protein
MPSTPTVTIIGDFILLESLLKLLPGLSVLLFKTGGIKRQNVLP